MKWNYERVCREAHKLRKTRDRTEHHFFFFLWRLKYDPEIAAVLHAARKTREHVLLEEELVKAGTLATWEAGFEKIDCDPDLAEEMGSKAVMALANVARERAPNYVESVRDWKREHRDHNPSLESAQRLADKVDPRESAPGPTQRKTEYQRKIAQLEAENKNLRAEVRALAKKLSDREKRVADLERKLEQSFRQRDAKTRAKRTARKKTSGRAK